jgi:glycosyltransferase involved in cell wall biosynthesis
MRVAIIIPAIAQAGPVLVMKFLTDELLRSEDYYIKVYYIDKKVDQDLRFSVPVECLSAGRFPFNDFDIIHTNGLRPDLFAFRNRKKIRYHISTIHNFVYKDLSFRYRGIISWLIAHVWLILWKRADKLICVSAAIKDYYLAWFPETKLAVIYNGIPEHKIENTLDKDITQIIDHYHSKGFTVLGVASNLNQGKGIDIVLKLMARDNDLSMVIIGTGPELMNLKELARKYNINNRVYFSGYKTFAVSYMKYFDLIVVPSRSEGFCLSLVEAVQQMAPVVCSDIPVFRELFNEEEVTFFDLDNTDSLATALQTANRTRKSKTDLAYYTYRNRFTSQLMSQKYLELYKSA